MATVVSHQAIGSIVSQRSFNFKASQFLKEPPLNKPMKLGHKGLKIEATASQIPVFEPVLSPSKNITHESKKKSSMLLSSWSS